MEKLTSKKLLNIVKDQWEETNYDFKNSVLSLLADGMSRHISKGAKEQVKFLE